jgi:hypothetical protein
MDELYARALVLSDGANTVALVSADLLYAPLEEITNPVRAILWEKLALPGQNVMICATHTHSGPEVFTRSKLSPKSRTVVPPLDQSYLQRWCEADGCGAACLPEHAGRENRRRGGRAAGGPL